MNKKYFFCVLFIFVFTSFCKDLYATEWAVEKNKKKVVDMFAKYATLKDPLSVQLKGVVVLVDHNGKGKRENITWCGYFNAKNSYGAYVGFQPFYSVSPAEGDGFVTFIGRGGTGIDEVKKQIGNKVCEGSGIYFR